MVNVRICEGDSCKMVKIKTDGPVSKESVEPLIADLTSNNDIVIFSKSWCPYCVTAKKLLKPLADKHNASLQEFIIDQQTKDVQAAIQMYLIDVTKQRTVPQICIKKQWLGGCSDVQALHKQGKLEPML